MTDRISNALHPPMTGQTYPGQGLSLSQLIFALNEELKRKAYSPSYVVNNYWYVRGPEADFLRSFSFDQVAQLDCDASAVLAGIREWRNSFVPINRLPFDVLSLIPTYLSSHDDRLRASFVCSQWRRAFLQRGDLWSELILPNGKVYVETFLERAKGSALDIFTDNFDPVVTWKLLSAYTEQIRRLNLECDGWFDIQELADIISEPLPLLHSLTVDLIGREDSPGCSVRWTPSSPLFSNAADLKAFHLRSSSRLAPSLSHFVFPNLVSFDFVTQSRRFRTSELLGFLEASPMLQTVHMEIFASDSVEVTPQERVVTLPRVETFTMVLGNDGMGYQIATHISCPSVRSTSFVHTEHRGAAPGSIFPDKISWDKIVSRYTRSTIEEVVLEIAPLSPVTCKLTFWSLDATAIELQFKRQADAQRLQPAVREEVFGKATWTLRDHPQLKDIKRLRICHGFFYTLVSRTAYSVLRLFASLGSLEELTIYGCDLQPYLHPFFTFNDFSNSNGRLEITAVFPQTKQLTILHPDNLAEDICAALVKLAKSQYELGKPFERMVFRGEVEPLGMDESLSAIGVEYRYEPDYNMALRR
jgi:hypothetical protein